MSSNAKPGSEKALAAYFAEMATVQVPTPAEEQETFRKLLEVESRMVLELLDVEGAWIRLKDSSKGEDRSLPSRPTSESGLQKGVLDFVRMSEPGRNWFDKELTRSLAKDSLSRPSGKDDRLRRARLRALDLKRDSIRNGFVKANLRLTVHIAKQYTKRCRHQGFGDLIQEGNLGLMKAVDRFDPDRGFRFATYATWWIRQQIKRAVSDKEHTIRVPVHMGELSAKLNRMDGDFMAETGHAMSPDEMALAANVPVEKVLSVLASRARMFYLDSPVGEDESMTLLETFASDAFPDALEELRNAEVREELLRLLSGLTPTESRVIRYRFGIDSPEKQLTLQEIAEHYDLSRERIRQIEEKALKKLRHRMSNRTFSEYMPEAV